jgi:aminopeptidase
MPTEEVFTAPHRARVDGVVRSSRPLVNGGTVIDDFELHFEAGAVVQARAGRGEAALRRILDTDEGASRLGEVALVPDSSPIRRAGVLFWETLFDENAASHIALGKAYPVSVRGGAKLREEDARAAGLNDSLTHVDFMIGSRQTDVDGVAADGARTPLMRDGEWVD